MTSRKDDAARQMVINGRYKLTSHLRNSETAAMFNGVDVHTGATVLVKLQHEEQSADVLRREAQVYQRLGQKDCLATLLWAGATDTSYVLVSEPLGPSLEELFEYCSHEFDLKTICMITVQAMDALAVLHAAGLVHGELKPSTLCMGGSERQGSTSKVQLADLSSCCPGPDAAVFNVTMNVPNLSMKKAAFTSLRAHSKLPTSVHDDLESLGYLVVLWTLGKLPWGKDRASEMMSFKRALSAEHLIRNSGNIPPEQLASKQELLEVAVSHIKRAQACARSHSQPVDFASFKSGYLKLMASFGVVPDLEYEWDRMNRSGGAGSKNNASNNKRYRPQSVRRELLGSTLDEPGMKIPVRVYLCDGTFTTVAVSAEADTTASELKLMMHKKTDVIPPEVLEDQSEQLRDGSAAFGLFRSRELVPGKDVSFGELVSAREGNTVIPDDAFIHDELMAMPKGFRIQFRKCVFLPAELERCWESSSEFGTFVFTQCAAAFQSGQYGLPFNTTQPKSTLLPNHSGGEDFPIAITYTDCVRLAVLQLIHSSNGKAGNLSVGFLCSGALEPLLPFQFFETSQLRSVANEVCLEHQYAECHHRAEVEVKFMQILERYPQHGASMFKVKKVRNRTTLPGATKATMPLPVSIGIGYHGVVLLHGTTYEAYACFPLDTIEDVHLEETASGNLDFCFRLREGACAAFKCDAAPELLSLYQRADSLRQCSGQHLSMQHSVQQLEGEDQELKVLDEYSDDAPTEMTEFDDETSLAEFSLASRASRRPAADASMIRSLVHAARGSKSADRSQSQGSTSTGGALNKAGLEGVAQIVSLATQKVADMKSITLAAASDLRTAQREAQDALHERNLVEMKYKERVAQLEEQVRNYRIRDMDKAMMSSSALNDDDGPEQDELEDEQSQFKAIFVTPQREEKAAAREAALEEGSLRSMSRSSRAGAPKKMVKPEEAEDPSVIRRRREMAYGKSRGR